MRRQGLRAAGVAVLLLAVHFGLAVTSVREKSATSDEPIHLASGLASWTLDHHRLNPEGGILTQAWAAIPAALGPERLPPADHPTWTTDPMWRSVPEAFLHDVGNDLEGMLWRARAMTALLGVAFGVFVFLWSRRLWGDLGAGVTLALYAFSPTVLAHSRLVTADLGLAFFFLLSVASLWRLLHVVEIRSLVASSASIGGLLLAKMSGVLIVPVGLGLLAVRLAAGRPLRVRWRGHERALPGRDPRSVAILAGALLAVAVGIGACVWAGYGFRYSGDPAHEGSPYAWSRYDGGGLVPDTVKWAAEQRLLPEPYLFGFFFTWDQSRGRLAFLDGDVGSRGWLRFFPLAFLYKTPLAVLALLALGAIAAYGVVRRRAPPGPDLYTLSPLLVLLVVYLVVSVTGSLNIGHRHILVAYPILFVLAGALGPWLAEAPRRAWRPAVVAALLAWLVVDCLRIWPHYLAYFNPIAGGPARGYRHLVDSSLDWGQDLGLLKKWLAAEGHQGEGAPPVYLAYFGPTRPSHYGIDATLLPGYPHPDTAVIRPGELRPGIYCISASILQLLWLRTTVRPFSDGASRRYEELDALWRAHAASEDDRARRERVIEDYLETIRTRALRRGGAKGEALAEQIEHQPRRAWREQWRRARLELADLELARLVAYLRSREPDHQIGYSILVYELGEGEVRAALAPDAAGSGRSPR